MTETTHDTATAAELTNRMNEFAEAYRADADLQARAETEPRAVLVERGLDVLAAPGVEVRIVADTDDTIHFMLPPDPNAQMADEGLMSIAGGATAAPPVPDYQMPGTTYGATSSGW